MKRECNSRNRFPTLLTASAENALTYSDFGISSLLANLLYLYNYRRRLIHRTNPLYDC